MVAATFTLQADVAAIIGRPATDASVLIEPLANEAGTLPVVDPTTGKLYVAERYQLGRTGAGAITLPKPTAMTPAGYQYRATVRFRDAEGHYYKTLPPITFGVPADTATLKLGNLADLDFVPPVYVPALLTARDQAVAAAEDADESKTAAAASAGAAFTSEENAAESADAAEQSAVAAAAPTDAQVETLLGNVASLARKRLDNVTAAVFNPMDPRFGAVGDGVTDDTAAVQACIDAAVAARGVFWWPGKNFRIRDTLTSGALRHMTGPGNHAGSSGAGANIIWDPLVVTDLKPCLDINVGTTGSIYENFTIIGPHGAKTLAEWILDPTQLPRMSAFTDGVTAIKVSGSAQPTFRFVRTQYVKVGLQLSSSAGHVSSYSCIWNGVFGVYNTWNSADYFFEDGQITGMWCGYAMGSGDGAGHQSGTAATLKRIHMGFSPYAFYQLQTLSDAAQVGVVPSGAYLDLQAVRFEQIGEAICKLLPTSTGTQIGGDGAAAIFSDPAAAPPPPGGTQWAHALPDSFIPAGDKQAFAWDLGRAAAFAFTCVGGNGQLNKSPYYTGSGAHGVLRVQTWDSIDGAPFMVPGVADEDVTIVNRPVDFDKRFSDRAVRPRAMRNRQSVGANGGNLLVDPEVVANWQVLGGTGAVVTKISLATAIAETGVVPGDDVLSYIGYDWDTPVMKITPNGVNAPNVSIALRNAPVLYDGVLSYTFGYWAPFLTANLGTGAGGATAKGTSALTATSAWRLRKSFEIQAAGAAGARSYSALNSPGGMSATVPTYIIGAQVSRGPAERPYARADSPSAKSLWLKAPDGTYKEYTANNDGTLAGAAAIQTVWDYVNTVDKTRLNDSSVTADASPIKVTALPVGTYDFTLKLYYNAATTADVKLSWILPSGTTGLWGSASALASTATTSAGAFAEFVVAQNVSITLGGIGADAVAVMTGTFVITTAGDVTLRWGQGTVDAANTSTIKALSSMSFRKIA